jgi:hypothetical protein
MALVFVVTTVKVVVNAVWIHLSDHCLCEHQTINISIIYRVGQDSSVGIATRYGLDGPGIESRWGARFSVSVQTVAGAHTAPPYNVYRIFPGGKAAGAWR